jgi:hypothetical protein
MCMKGRRPPSRRSRGGSPRDSSRVALLSRRSGP